MRSATLYSQIDGWLVRWLILMPNDVERCTSQDPPLCVRATGDPVIVLVPDEAVKVVGVVEFVTGGKDRRMPMIFNIGEKVC